MRSVFVLIFSIFCLCLAHSQDISVTSPDGHLSVKVFLEDGKPMYSIIHKGKSMLLNSPLGLITNEGDFSTNMRFVRKSERKIDEKYVQDKIKKAQVHYKANVLLCTFQNAKEREISVLFHHAL